MVDPFGRAVDYLRISVTGQCDERCLYCMPGGYLRAAGQAEPLKVEEILRVVRVAAGLGFRKFRLTGGEPLLREDLPEMIRGIARVPGVRGIGLSTNGTRLAMCAQALRDAGLTNLNVSLDALDPKVYRGITGGGLENVLSGIRAAASVGFNGLKLNCVLLRGINEQQIWPLTLFAAENGCPLRFVEVMPLTRTAAGLEQRFFSVAEAANLIAEKDELVPVDKSPGWGPATYYRLKRTGALVGFIGAITDEHFCHRCNKIRVTSDGKVRPCLGDGAEIDLRPALGAGGSDAEVRSALLRAIDCKPVAHGFGADYVSNRPMPAIGG